MAEGTSVGKISLQVDLQGDMKQQIADMANNFALALKTSLEKSTTGMLNGVEKAIDNAMKGINTSIDQGLEKMKAQMESFISSLQAMTAKIKVPKQMPLPSNTVPKVTPGLPSTSPRGPPEVSKIDSEAISAEISKVTQHLDLVNQKIELQQQKLVGLRESYDRALNPNIKNKLATQINNTELSIMKLTEASDKMGFKLNDLDAKLNGTSTVSEKLGKTVKATADKIKQSASNASKNITPLGKASEAIGGKFNKMGNMIKSALKRVLIMATLYKIIRGFMSYLNSALATNTQFSNSLAQVKSNLQVAFIPIYNAMLPAINALMSGLARATAYLASFMSVIFGSSLGASAASAKAMNKQKDAIAGVGAASKKAAKEMKSLAGFDEINNLGTPDDTAAGGGGASGSAPIIEPNIDTGGFESKLKAFFDMIAPLLEPAKQALGRLKEAFDPLKQNLFSGLQWLMDNILIPLGKWVITDAVPGFIDILSGAIKVLNSVIDALKPLFQWLWDNMLQPIAEWTGGVIVTVLEGISTMLSGISTWIDGNQKAFENIAIIIGSIAAAWALVNAALVIWAGVGAIATAVTSAFGAAVALATSPVTLVILAIGALIAIGVLLWKNWDQISAWLKKTWEGIKTAASTTWGNIVSTIKNVFNGIGNWFSNVYTGAWNGIKNAFSAVGSFFQGIWNTIKNTFTTIGSVIGNGIANAFKTVVNSVISFAENTINGFIRAINSAIKLINLIPGVNIKTLSMLNIPKLATGGMIEQPTLAMVGEAGKEAVLPIDKDRGAMEQIANMLIEKMGGNGGSANESGDLIIMVGEDELARIAIKAIKNRERRTGKPILT